ncbi:hypothetical protein BJY00DRAFT_280561, partial [Aspergillus carlsbadensis]
MHTHSQSGKSISSLSLHGTRNRLREEIGQDTRTTAQHGTAQAQPQAPHKRPPHPSLSGLASIK